MTKAPYQHWVSALKQSQRRPAYILIADLIASDIDSGFLQARDKLPTLRDLAAQLDLNYTTIARAYSEARGRGLIDSQPGAGTFVRGQAKTQAPQSGKNIEMTMNLPPEPQNTELMRRIRRGFQRMSHEPDLYPMFRYQDFGGLDQDKEAAISLLAPLIDKTDIDRMLVCPGIHSILVGLLTQIAKKGTIICVQNLVYPGLKAIAAQLDIKLYAMPSDNEGPLIRPLEQQCKKEHISAFYLNPTLQNPTTRTISRSRREAIASLALRYSIPIIEDDAYGLLPQSPISPMVNLAPEITYYINGLAKCFGAGFRTAFLQTPSKQLATRTAGAMRSLSVMASPITNSLVTQWIIDGTLTAMTAEIRQESQQRQALAHKYLADFKYESNNESFHLWLHLPKSINQTPSTVSEHMRSQGISAVGSAAFCADNNPPHAVRICLGGSDNVNQCEQTLIKLAHFLKSA